MSKPKKIAVRYIETNDKKSDTDDDQKGLEEKQEANDESCPFC